MFHTILLILKDKLNVILLTLKIFYNRLQSTLEIVRSFYSSFRFENNKKMVLWKQMGNEKILSSRCLIFFSNHSTN